MVCVIVCLLPKRWTWGEPLVKEEESVASSAELGQAQSGGASHETRETQETRPEPGGFSRSTTFRPEDTPVFRLNSDVGGQRR